PCHRDHEVVHDDADVAKPVQDLGHDPQRAQGVPKAGVLRAVIGAVGGAELADPPQPLKLRGIDQLQKERLAQRDEVVNRIAIRLLPFVGRHALTSRASRPRRYVPPGPCQAPSCSCFAFCHRFLPQDTTTVLKAAGQSRPSPTRRGPSHRKLRPTPETPPLWPRHPPCQSARAGSGPAKTPAPRVKTRRSSLCRSPRERPR